VVNGSVERVEMVDDTFATLDFGRMRNITFDANAFHSVSQITVSPVIIEHSQTTASDTWVVSPGAFLPFGGRARVVSGLVPEGPVQNTANVAQFVQPHVLVEQGSARNQVHVRWPTPVRGRALLTVRVDNPT
jgi:hypothetical protein